MARVFGRPGVYLKNRAKQLAELNFTIVLVVILVIGAALGYSYGRLRSGWLLLAFLAVVLGTRVLTKVLEPWVNRLQNERRKYLRGEQAEDLVGWLLDDLPDDWYIFHGVQIQDGQDLDHILVGPGGVFLVSTKNLRGLFSVDDKGQLLYNNKPTDLAAKARGLAMALRERLVALLGADIFVNAVLAVPFAFVEVCGQYKNV